LDLSVYYTLTKEKNHCWIGLYIKYLAKSIELIPNGLAVSRRCTRPASVNISRAIGLRKTIVALRRCSPNDCAKHFEVYDDGNNFAATARFY
jgi:hypothetical protein